MVVEKPLFEFQVVLKESITTPDQWEFVHPGEDSLGKAYPNYTSMLPEASFPITHKVLRNGIIVNCNDMVKGAFHRYKLSRFGEHFYIGSPYQELRGDTAQQWRSFVARFGAISGKRSIHSLKVYPDNLFVFA